MNVFVYTTCMWNDWGINVCVYLSIILRYSQSRTHTHRLYAFFSLLSSFILHESLWVMLSLSRIPHAKCVCFCPFCLFYKQHYTDIYFPFSRLVIYRSVGVCTWDRWYNNNNNTNNGIYRGFQPTINLCVRVCELGQNISE